MTGVLFNVYHFKFALNENFIDYSKSMLIICTVFNIAIYISPLARLRVLYI